MLENVSQDINKKVTFIWDQTGFMPCWLKIFSNLIFLFKYIFLAVFISFELMKTFFSKRQIKKSRQEAWTAWLPWHMMMAFFLGLAQQLWDKETGKDNHLNSMQESWGKWRIVSKRYFFTLFFFCLTQWNARIWWWALQSFFLRKKSLKIDLHVLSCLS